MLPTQLASRLTLLLLLTGCDRAPSAPPGASAVPQKPDKPAGVRLYEQVSHTWPEHDEYELDHQLTVRTEDPARVMELLAIEPGMTVADVGCGSGFYTTRMADAVGSEGVVWAIDIQQVAIDYLRDRLAEPEMAAYGNVRLALSKVDDSTLPAGTIQRGLFTHADFYAYETLLDENNAMLDSLYQAFAPGGLLVVLQDVSITTHEGVPDIIAKNFANHGFVEDRAVRYEEGLEVYQRFRKPE